MIYNHVRPLRGRIATKSHRNNPQVASLRSLPGANHVAPLRGATGLTGHIVLSLNKYKKNTNSKEFVFF
jgi:hypothetical protein